MATQSRPAGFDRIARPRRVTVITDTRPGAPPLSVAQEGLWYESVLAPSRISYNETISFRKEGSLDVAALRRALNEIVRRHEAWRTTFDRIGGEPVQVVGPPPSFDLPVLDLSHLTVEEAERQAVRVVAAASKVPYDLRRGPLVRPRLIRLPAEHRLYLAMHHLVFDGVSVYRVVLPELIAIYDDFCAGRPSQLPEPRGQYADYARWEQEWIAGPRVARRLEHWRERLASLPALRLPHDHRRPPTPRFRGGVLSLSVPAGEVDRLRRVGQGAGATLFQVLAATWSVLLGRYSGQDDVVFATPADLRQRPEFESVVGYSLTPVVLRVGLDGDPAFADLVVRVRNELLDGLDHLVPFERLVRELSPEGLPNANPVYQTMLVLEPAAAATGSAWSLHQMEGEIGDAVGTTKLDLELELDERPEGHLAGRLIYDRDLFERATVARMAEQWSRVVAAVAADPTVTVSRIPLLAAAEERRQIVEWNATATGYPRGGVHELVRRRAAGQPDRPAVSAGGEAISYAALDARADGIALQLLAAGVKPGDVVAVCSAPSVDLAAGALGVLKAGAAHLVLDPGLPPARLELLVADSGAVTLLTQPDLVSRLVAPPAGARGLDGPDGDERPVPASSEAVGSPLVCCVHYASDATGDRHGVPIRHASVVNLATAMATELGLGAADTVLVLSSAASRVPLMDLWVPLIAGARILVAPAGVAAHGARLSRLIAEEGVTLLYASPTRWETLIDTGLKGARSLRAVSGGEPLSEELAEKILARCRVLWNAYGAPETGGFSTLARLEGSAPVTIGRPIANTRVYVLDRENRPAPIGVTGELRAAGDGVAAGYLDRPDASAEAFVDDPFGPGRAYRTGDQASWLPDGRLALVADLAG